MADYDLSGLSTRSFEKLIQSISGKVLGPGTVTFGDGPDGGREATFEGRMDYPSKTDPWDGYCVIQAKFLQRPKSAGSDGRWALKQLEGELKAFADPKKRRRQPDYYIFATNVILTPVQQRGGKDKAAALFRKYHKKVRLRGTTIWDFDEIGKFLDTLADIRRAYAAWITPGDVLSEVMQQLASRTPDFLEVMTNFLAKELRSDQFANLEQAGHSTEERIPLARVFVDLPTTTQRTTEPPDEMAKGSEITEMVATLVEEAKDPMDPASIVQARPSPEGRLIRPEGPQPGRYVLVGGPGQGKTTVGQFACQLFRTALLQDRPHQLLSAEVRDTLSDLMQQCRASDIGLPKARRFPVRIALSELAAALNTDRDLSLLAFIAGQIGRRTGRTIALDDLRSWLSNYPWFLVLDGLDEVPPSTNREDVLKKVEDFWIDATQLNADVLVLATTRPQGYSDDFSPAYYRHLWLAPLSPKRAMVYAKRLVAVRYAGESDRQQKILARLQQASKQAATARLMRSPLQITIMAALVDQTGTPPQDRWRLFHDYYEVIYNRERERPIPAAELLRDYKPNIDAIHHQVGLILQVESERAGGTEAKLPAERFAGLVTARLEEEGFSGPALLKLRDRIIDAAANRLVFLVGLEAGQVGFEIRALQEYMAAEAIMTGSQDNIQERLRRFAPVASWRNVFLFAAGRCFLQEQYLRDTIQTVCQELNDQLAGPVGQATLAGSVLALDLLEDGVARRQPKYARLLAHCAVRLLELPPGEIHGRLGDASEGEVEIVLGEELEKELSALGGKSLAAWGALLILLARGSHWASQLADRFWPDDPSLQLTILSLPTARWSSAWVDSRLEAVIKRNPPSEVWRLARRPPSTVPQRPLRFHELWTERHHLDTPPRLEVQIQHLDLSFVLTPVDLARQLASQIRLNGGDVHHGWLPTIEVIKFSRSPSKDTLAEGLRRIAAVEETFLSRLYYPDLSWVFGSCLASVRSSAELGELAERAVRGDLGDSPDWLAAERRWRERGVTMEDFLYLTDDRWPFDSNIAHRGFPVGQIQSLTWHERRKGGAVGDVLDFLARLSDVPRVQAALVPLLGFLFPRFQRHAVRAELPSVSPELFMRLMGPSMNLNFHFDFLLLIAQWALQDERWLDVLDEIGRTRAVHFYYFSEESLSQALSNLFVGHPDRIGLLPLIVAGFAEAAAAHRFAGPTVDPSVLPRVQFEHYDAPKIQWAAVVLELAQAGVHRKRASELATITTVLKSRGVADLRDALAIITRYERFDEATDHYLLDLRRQLSGAKWEDQVSVVRALNNSFRRRSSGVTEPLIWRRLALPEKLLDLVVTSR